MVSTAKLVAAVPLSLVISRPGTAIMPARLHPVAADGHRAPPGGVGLTAVDQKQPALVVRTWPQPARAGYPQPIPRQHGARSAFGRNAGDEPPLQPVAVDLRSQRSGLDEPLQCRRPRVATHHLLQDRSRVEECGELVVGRYNSPLTHPRPGRTGIREIVPHRPVDHRGAVQEVEKKAPRLRDSTATRSISNLQITIDRLQHEGLTVTNH